MVEKLSNIVIYINNHSSIPKYIQVADSISRDILTGKIKKEQRISSINELSEAS